MSSLNNYKIHRETKTPITKAIMKDKDKVRAPIVSDITIQLDSCKGHSMMLA